MLLLNLLDPALEILIFLGHLVHLGVQLQGLLPKNDHLLLQVLDTIIRRKHFLLFLRFMLYLS